MSLLQAIELSKQYNDVYALRNLNLSINKGEICCSRMAYNWKNSFYRFFTGTDNTNS